MSYSQSELITRQAQSVFRLPVLRVVGELLFAAYLLEYFFADVLQFVIWQEGHYTQGISCWVVQQDVTLEIKVFCTVLGRCLIGIADR